MTPDEIAACFTRADGSFHFARWARPLAPVMFGVTDETVSVFKGAIQAVAAISGHHLTETDPELGANLMWFFVRDWRELSETPNLERMIPDLAALVGRLEREDANQYRLFRFDGEGAIRAGFVFLRMDEALSGIPAEALALGQAAQVMLIWADAVFRARSAVSLLPGGAAILHPEIGNLLKVAYDPVLPHVSHDSAHALRLAARMGRAS